MIHLYGKAPLRARNLSALVAATGLAFLSGTGASAAQTVVKWLHLETVPSYVKVWEDIAAKYEAAHPDVDIQLQFLDNEAFKAKLPTLLQSEDAPDFFYSWGGGVLKQQSETGTLMDLSDAMNADGGAWVKTYNPAAVKGFTFNEKIFAVPYKMGTVSFFYNKALFDKAGVKAEGIKTWDNFIEAVKTLKAAGITPIAGGGGDKWPLHFYWSYLVMRNGGQEVFSAAKNKEGEGFLDPAIIKAGEQLAELGKLEPFQGGYLGATWPQTLGVFGDGKAAIILSFENTEANQRTQSGDGKGLASDNIGRFAFPVVEGGAGAATDTLGGLNGWAVTRKAPPQALDFLRYLTDKDNERIQAAAGMIIPAALGAEDGIADPLMRASADQLAASTWHQNYFDQDLGPAVGRVVNDVTIEILTGQMSPEEGAQMIQDALELE
ncbi:carbohydrate ABC transporter substrate-binding protein [Phyllobacterium salinisoli]|uniref:Carbohydrate ABC transporter substrate-binding protein n=1 Tax=Phyllobacterium salinisoli TaxID=1899321 RepID=A0A368JY16_9HYPH|nr:ABC transporter substrate-binding protein [Phyllobacterium salinisoli]RCS21851.1 carbohydrate ABC transporter substrate-binding protein [Phyllobacterium salinisoli]